MRPFFTGKTMSVTLDKKINSIVSLTKDTRMVSLAKNAGETLKKTGLADHMARVVLVLDISGSMSPMFRDGTVSEIVRKALAVGYLLDDNGEIDIILFGEKAQRLGTVSLNNLETTVTKLIQTRLEPYTRYEEAIEAVRDLLRDESPDQDYPTLVQFITDGEPTSSLAAEKAIREASRAGVFFQFVGIGGDDYDPRKAAENKKGFFARVFGGEDFEFKFLKKLDDLSGRHTDNAGFFAVKNPKTISEDSYYDLLLSEYPRWFANEFPRTALSDWL